MFQKSDGYTFTFINKDEEKIRLSNWKFGLNRFNLSKIKLKKVFFHRTCVCLKMLIWFLLVFEKKAGRVKWTKKTLKQKICEILKKKIRPTNHEDQLSSHPPPSPNKFKIVFERICWHNLKTSICAYRSKCRCLKVGISFSIIYKMLPNYDKNTWAVFWHRLFYVVLKFIY